jgi:hypothetical protein
VLVLPKNAHDTEHEAPPPRQSFLYKSIITRYRVFAIAVLYAVLAQGTDGAISTLKKS